MSAHPDATTARTPIGKVVGIALALVGVVAVIVLAFSWPAVTAEPKDLPVAIAGPAAAIAAAEQAVDAQAEGAIAFVEVDEITLQGEVKRIFSGWMFAASPGLHGVEHPIYDIWLTDCKQPQTTIATAAPDPATPKPPPPPPPAQKRPAPPKQAVQRPPPPPPQPQAAPPPPPPTPSTASSTRPPTPKPSQCSNPPRPRPPQSTSTSSTTLSSSACAPSKASSSRAPTSRSPARCARIT